jgi:hypothetical protein
MDGEPGQAPEKSDVADPSAVLNPKIVELYTKSVCRAIDFYGVIDVSFSQSRARHERKRSSRQTYENIAYPFTVGPMPFAYQS